MVSAAPNISMTSPWRFQIPRDAVRGLVSLLVVAALTAFNLKVLGRSDVTNNTLVYLFGIALISIRLGYRASLVAAITSALCLDYYLLPPYDSFILASGREILTFAGLFGTSVFISTLNERLRQQAQVAHESERRMEALYRLARELVNAGSVDEVCTSSAEQIGLAADGSACILVRSGDRFERAFRAGGVAALETEDLPAATWAASHLEIAGLGTRNCPEAGATFVPLIAARGCVGVLRFRPRDSEQASVPPDTSSLILSMSRQVALALERTLLVAEKQSAQIDAETERIRNAVLSAVSHDLRTPLAVIASASSTLVENGERLHENARAEMARIISDEARRLGELLKSLLDVTRLQSGGLKVNREWESLEEIVSSVLRRIEEHAAGRKLRVNVPNDLPLLQLDAILIEQVLLNMVDNAFKHALSEQPVELDLATRDSRVIVSVIDHGKGVGSDELARIFDKFYRSDETVGEGLGLGLTIARGIVEAHGGQMWASHTQGGGLTVQFSLPQSGLPQPRISTDTGETFAAGGRS